MRKEQGLEASTQGQSPLCFERKPHRRLAAE